MWYYKEMKATKRQFTGVFLKRGAWYIGWVEEVPGANTQGRTLREVKENLKEALALILTVNKDLSGRNVIREPLSVTI